MKKILLPTDFSKNAWNAIVFALEFYKSEKCLFYLLHTYTPTFYRLDYLMGGPAYSIIPDTEVELAQAGLEKTLADIHQKYNNPKHEFKTLSAFNTLTEEVREVIERKNIDLIIMGTQGATGTKEILLGTHTVHVIRKSKIPVLAIPADYAFKKIKSVLFPTDYLSGFTIKELEVVENLVKMHKAKLIVMHVKEEYDMSTEQKENLKFLVDYFDGFDCGFEEMKGGLMPNAIHKYILEHDLDLLVMMNRKHSFLERLLSQQNIDSIGYHTTIPFLVIPQTSNEPVKK